MKDYSNFQQKISDTIKKPAMDYNFYSCNELADLSTRLYRKEKKSVTLDTKSIWNKLTSAQKQAYNTFSSSQFAINEFPDYMDGYEHAEYFKDINIIKLSNDILSYIKTYGSLTCIMNEYTKSNDKLIINPDLPSRIRYSLFTTSSFQVLTDGTITLCCNVPYEYYKNIYTFGNFLYLCNDNKIWSTGSDENKTLDQLCDIARRGIINPLVLEINNGTIISAKDSYGRLLCAMWLRLPVIPVILYITTEQVDEMSELVPMKGDKELANKICAPYMHFL